MEPPEPGLRPMPDMPRVPIVEPLPIALIDTPLDYIVADHARQRSVCAALKRFGETGAAPRADVDAVLAFLDRDLALHHDDEDHDLFPALRRRARPDDNLGAVMARLTEDHRQSHAVLATIVAALGAAPARDPAEFDDAARHAMQAYAASEHRHLAMENGIVLALARVRLKASDLKTISQHMRQRRGMAA